MDEKHPQKPDDPYSVSKMAFEHYLRIYDELGTINSYVVRFTNTYGPRLRLDNPYKGATQIFISRCLQGKNPIVFGDGTQSRAFTFIGDIKKPICDVIDYPELINNPINIGSNFIYTVKDVAQEIINQINPELELSFLPKRQKDIAHAYCNVSKMEKLMNYKCKTNIEEGLRQTIEWAKEQKPDGFNYEWPIEIPCLLENTYRDKKI